MTRILMRLAAYSGSTFVDILPRPQRIEWGNPLSDATAALTVVYSSRAVGGEVAAAIFDNEYDVAVELSVDGAAWFEPAGARFAMVDDQSNSADATGLITMAGILAPVYDMSGLPNLNTASLNDQGVRQFTNANAGTMLQSYVNDGKSRAMLTLFESGFTTARDASNADWALQVTMGLRPDATMLQLLESLTAQGMIDWRTQGNRLNVYNADMTMKRDLSATVELVLAREISDGPQARSSRERVDRALVVGDEGYTLLREAANPNRKRGRRAAVISQGGVTQSGTAILLADATLKASTAARDQLTRELRLSGADLRYLPYRDYLPGDTVMAPGRTGLEALRVRQITLIADERGQVSGSLLLNDRFLEASVRQSKRIQGILGGSTISGGSTAQPVPPQKARATPAAVTGLGYSTEAFINENGVAQAVLNFSWTPVSLDTKGNPITISGYQVAVGPNHILVETNSSSASTVVAVRSRDSYKVRAISSEGVLGPWSAAIATIAADDVTPPPAPSKPIITTKLGTATVTWDGRDASNANMVSDFSRLEVLGDNGVLYGFIYTVAEPLVLTQFDRGTTINVRFLAVDRSGNRSALSAITTVTIASVLDDTGLDAALKGLQSDLAANNTKLTTDLGNLNTKLTTDLGNLDATLRNKIGVDVSAASLKALQDANTYTDTKVAGAGGNANWFSPNPPPTPPPNSYKAGDRWFQWTTPGRTIIGQWVLTSGGWEPEQIRNELIANLDAGKITSGFIDTARLQAGSILADRLIIGAGQNVIVDPNFQNPIVNAYRVAASNGGFTFSNGVARSADTGQTILRLDSSSLSYYQEHPVDSARQYVVTFDARLLSGTGQVGARARYTAYDGTLVNAGVQSTVVATTAWQTFSLVWAPPVDAKNFSLLLYTSTATSGRVEFRNPFLATRTGVTQIEDGAITTEKVAANAITANQINANAVTTAKIAAGAVTANEITAGAVNADKIAANAVTVDKINANAVTTAKIATNAVTANEIAAGTIVAGNIATGAVTADKIEAGAVTAEKVSGTAIDGKLITGATVRTSTSGTRTQLDADGLTVFRNNVPYLQLRHDLATGIALRDDRTGVMKPIEPYVFNTAVGVQSPIRSTLSIPGDTNTGQVLTVSLSGEDGSFVTPSTGRVLVQWTGSLEWLQGDQIQNVGVRVGFATAPSNSTLYGYSEYFVKGLGNTYSDTLGSESMASSFVVSLGTTNDFRSLRPDTRYYMRVRIMGQRRNAGSGGTVYLEDCTAVVRVV